MTLATLPMTNESLITPTVVYGARQRNISRATSNSPSIDERPAAGLFDWQYQQTVQQTDLLLYHSLMDSQSNRKSRKMFERVKFIPKYSPKRIPYADEESGTDVNTGTVSDIDLTMKSSATSPSTQANNRRPIPMDVNMYATRKTIAQGIMDLGLMCANASQLKYVLLNATQHRYFQVTVSLIVVSILLQVIVGIIFIVLGRLNINFVQDRRKADMFNNASVILIFLITVVNVLITAFGPSESFAHLYHQNPGKLTSWTNFYHGSEPPSSS